MSVEDEGDLAIDDEDEAGEDDDESLADILGSRIEPRLARAILDDICAQLAVIHARGAAHGGLEPPRILLVEEPGKWRPRVEVIEAGGEPMNLMYCAPERQSGKFDSRADVYSVGAIAHHMIVGQLPDRGGSPPSDLWPGIPGPVEALLVRLLSRDPGDRPTIREAREGFAILDAPPWWKTWRGGALGGGTLAVILLGWLVLRPAAPKPPTDESSPEPAQIAAPPPSPSPSPTPPPPPPPTPTPPPPPTPAASVPAAAPLPVLPDAHPAVIEPPPPPPPPVVIPDARPVVVAPPPPPPAVPDARPAVATPPPPPPPPPSPPAPPARATPPPPRPAATPTRTPPPAAKPKPKPAKPRNDDSLMDPFAK